MNEKEFVKFVQLAQQCNERKYTSINVASKIRSDAIIAAWHELDGLRDKKDLENLICLAWDAWAALDHNVEEHLVSSLAQALEDMGYPDKPEEH